ncbi:hypothetical protein PR202_ga07900 [Eleusine coracana subsp. coracana]|uniref:Haloacid dehalogenase-like hydrolase domain-containing protein Sgpp n=1 Tax=Eleusine coracana subsp. coracana TaxID=191504 RepID=A0AAV5C165_ELECO|nr:hypothetical protein PR202_ga07900 [Eleusine coracana subsp. coracana]
MPLYRLAVLAAPRPVRLAVLVAPRLQVRWRRWRRKRLPARPPPRELETSVASSRAGAAAPVHASSPPRELALAARPRATFDRRPRASCPTEPAARAQLRAAASATPALCSAAPARRRLRSPAALPPRLASSPSIWLERRTEETNGSMLAAGQLKALDGLHQLCRWIQDRNLKRAAVTNAPRANAELMLSLLGLTEFFPVLVIGSECDRAKPFPDPYLKALQLVGAAPEHTFIFEDSASGIRAGVAAGMPVVGLTTGNPEKVLNDAGASLLIKDFQDPKLLAMLEELEAAAARTWPAARVQG